MVRQTIDPRLASYAKHGGRPRRRDTFCGMGSLGGDDVAHATALVELAEAAPALGNHTAHVRTAIDAAAAVLDTVAAPVLRARLLLRLAEVQLVEQDLGGADRALAAVADHVPDHVALRFLTGVRACRVALRRGAEQRAQAGDVLLASAARLPALDTGDPLWQRVTAEIILGVAEVALHQDVPDPGAFEPLQQLIDGLAGPPLRPGTIDTVFTGTQLLAAYAMSLGDGPRATAALRTLVRIAVEVGAPADEVEARLALTGVLIDTGTLVAREEAAHHVQRARDCALEHGLTNLHQATLVAQAAVMSAGGKLAGALDRMLELARSAAVDQDVPRYVASVGVMADLYARAGDHVSAFRTLAEANHALSRATGSDASPLFRPHLAALQARIGAPRLEQIAADVAAANALAEAMRDRPASESS